MEGRFQNKVVLVTGAARGIGRASASAFAREGAKVVLADVAAEDGQKALERIQKRGCDAVFVRTDVSQASQVEELVRKTIERYGRLDCAHNNAGISGTRARVADCTEESWDQTIAINLKGVFLSMKYEIPPMLALGRGAIVNTASVFGLIGAPRVSAYVASKHAILGLTKTAALEYCRRGIRINAVCPGLIDTGMAEDAILGEPKSDAESKSLSFRERLVRRGKKTIARSLLIRMQPSRRMGTPEEVAEAVLWLCSDEASYINGHGLVLDGGFILS